MREVKILKVELVVILDTELFNLVDSIKSDINMGKDYDYITQNGDEFVIDFVAIPELDKVEEDTSLLFETILDLSRQGYDFVYVRESQDV